MGVDLLSGERILWQGSPVRRSVFLRQDPKWIRFSLKFDAVLLVFLTAVVGLLHLWLGPVDSWTVKFTAGMFAASVALHHAEPFVWRFLTLHRTTYYVTNHRVVSTPGRRARAVKLAEIDALSYDRNADGTGYVRLDHRVMPDGFGNGTVAELIHVPDVDEVVALLANLTGRTPAQTLPKPDSASAL
ncbi:hypothetical protein LFM09_31815 [Lentzea alba]|uniref:hypothetical protein n=1 Tax=Lentzea alba TaxID=2714351 RepID=UPI0039BF65D7